MRQYIGIVLLVVGVGSYLTNCKTTTPEPTSVEQLITLLQTPDSAAFPMATTKLGEMEAKAAPAASVLAKAMQYPRRDSYLATQALIKIGPAAEGAIPELIKALRNERSEVRAEAAIVLGVIGPTAQCAVPDLARLLGDEAPEVPSSAARALDAITGVDLVEEINRLTFATYIIYDEDGDISEKAHRWWRKEGQYKVWTQGSDLCQEVN